MSVTVSGNIYAGAITHKWAGALVSCKKDGDKTIVTFDAGSPVSEKTAGEISAAQSEYDAYLTETAYKDKRRGEYPAIGDQLDALYHAGVFPTDMAAKIKAVKDKYSKGD